MFRPWRHLCRQHAVTPIGRLLLYEKTSPSCWRPSTVRAQIRASDTFRPRHFTTSHSLRAEPPKASTPSSPEPGAPATAAETHSDHVSPSPSPQTPRRRRRRRRRRGLYYAAAFLFFGIIMGTLVSNAIAPPSLPAPGSDQDAYMQTRIQAQGAALPIVQQLEADPSWTSWDAYSGVSAAGSRITSGPMAGSSGLAFQRVFHNAATGEVVTVVYFGAAMAGFPGVVHGGALATVLDESLGRCAIFRFPSRTGVTANLEMQYRAPAMTNAFYVIRTTPIPSDDDHAVGKDGVRKGDRKLWVRGVLENEKGKVAVEAKGLFVVPRTYKLRPLVEGF
ncbi:hypothetical protein F5Y09DRAFT_173216 [Xylaria sp. FL1042]|nr:hypothetical protein F5Y09DRAFT_173216 [Xylaria sp. FL1042]